MESFSISVGDWVEHCMLQDLWHVGPAQRCVDMGLSSCPLKQRVFFQDLYHCVTFLYHTKEMFVLKYPFTEGVALNKKFIFNKLGLRQPAQNTSKVVYCDLKCFP